MFAKYGDALFTNVERGVIHCFCVPYFSCATKTMVNTSLVTMAVVSSALDNLRWRET